MGEVNRKAATVKGTRDNAVTPTDHLYARPGRRRLRRQQTGDLSEHPLAVGRHGIGRGGHRRVQAARRISRGQPLRRQCERFCDPGREDRRRVRRHRVPAPCLLQKTRFQPDLPQLRRALLERSWLRPRRLELIKNSGTREVRGAERRIDNGSIRLRAMSCKA